jgi:hypothetical protein
VIDPAEFTPEETAQEIILCLCVKAASDLKKNPPERDGKLIPGTKIENEERMRLSPADARICASVAAMR